MYVDRFFLVVFAAAVIISSSVIKSILVDNFERQETQLSLLPFFASINTIILAVSSGLFILNQPSYSRLIMNAIYIFVYFSLFFIIEYLIIYFIKFRHADIKKFAKLSGKMFVLSWTIIVILGYIFSLILYF